MKTQRNDEKNIILKLKHQLGRMMVQVDYMYRNDREMSRLDLDIMMERTRDMYDLLCDYQIDTNDSRSDEEDGAFEGKPISMEIDEGSEMMNHDVELEIETPEKSLVDEDSYNAKEENEKVFEDFEENIEEKHIETIHILPVDEDDLDDADEEDEEDWEDEEDEMFRIEPKEEYETPAEPEDNSLAARLQRTPVKDIRQALGINDKMMIINDLFGGSVERYNKSIDALNDFPTLFGARVYMSELQIELQWDVECQSYKMLYDIVERRFI